MNNRHYVINEIFNTEAIYNQFKSIYNGQEAKWILKDKIVIISESDHGTETILYLIFPNNVEIQFECDSWSEILTLCHIINMDYIKFGVEEYEKLRTIDPLQEK